MDFYTAVIFLLTLLGIVFYYYLLKQKEEDEREQKNSLLSSLSDQQSLHEDQHGKGKDPSSPASSVKLCRKFPLAEIKLATNDFDDAFVIGKGGFGKVYKGLMNFGEEGIDIAIKRLNLDSNQGATEFRAEIEMLSQFHHSHIVSLLGYHEGSDKREMVLVYEYMSNGSLEDHLHKRRANGSNCSLLTWVQRLHICIGAARGLDYLHTGTSVQSRVIHRDIKSSNILLDEHLAAKISDFGLSRIGPANQSGTTNVYTDLIKGTFGYMDAEYFSTHRLTRKSDVYAFGVVLLEVLCGRPALDFTLDEEQHSLSVWARDCIREGNIDRIIDPCLKGQTAANCLNEFGQIAYECILTSSRDRPTMTKVVARLKFVLASGSQKPGGVTIAEKVWARFSIGIPGLKNRGRWSNDDRSKQAKIDKSATTMELAEGSNVNADKDPLITQNGTHNLKIFTFDELRRATRNFRPSATLGVSDDGSVFRGWVDRASYAPSVSGVGIAVAINIANTDNVQSLDEWQAEVNRGKFSHPNLVKLLGYCSEDGKLLLVHEYIPKRNFIDIVHRYPLPWSRTMKIAIGVAKGLAFLHNHERQSTPIHRTFNASNILLNENDEAKLYFGWASLGRIPGSLTVLMSNALTILYNPPEYMATGLWYVKSDVYAFGVMMLGMLAGLGFFDDNRCSSPESLVEWARTILSDNRKLQRVMDPWLEQGDPPKGASKAAELILSCLQISPENRPSMKEIVVILEGINSIKM